MRAMRRSLAAGLLVAAIACDYEVPNYNDSSLQALENNPTPSGLATLAQGLLYEGRTVAADYAQHLGIIGRETYNLSVANGTLPTYLLGPINTGVFFVISTWRNPYQGMREANILLNGLDQAAGLTDAQKQGYRGFAKTMQAYFLLHIAVSRDSFGAPIDVNIAPTELASIASKAQVYGRIDQLLDEGKASLQGAGAAFAFGLTPGFTGFSTPTTFLRVNRAIKARADVYNNNWAGALAALSESFLDTTASLDLGAYHTFTTNAGDATNPLFRSDFYWAHPSIRSEAQQRADLTLDLRAQNKVRVGATGTLIGLTSNLQYNNPSSNTSPLPLIRNEELILLRAEANLGAGNTTDALTDINTIRVKSGGLAPLTAGAWNALGPAGQLTELLYEKRYSLWWEWGHRWIDARHYGRLGSLPRDVATHKIFDILPYESGECFQRQQNARGCTGVSGL